MLIVGLTGSIGSGKSLAAKCFQDQGVPIQDSDAEVHRLLREDQTLINTIQDRWPTAVEDGQVVRPKLGEIVFADRAELKRLENMIHPHLHQAHRRFLGQHSQIGTPIVVIDMPLLFETGFDHYMDVTVCVIADDELRLQRVLRREHMTVEKFKARDELQMPQAEKKKRADFLLNSGLDKGDMYRQVEELICTLQDRKGTAWGPHWSSGLKKG